MVSNNQSPTEAYADDLAEMSTRKYSLHAIIIVLSVLMTFSAWQFAKRQSESRIEQRFVVAQDQVIGLIQDRMAKYEDALQAGVAMIESHGGSVARSEWATFSANMNIDQKYPGINGIGVIHVLARDEFEGYLRERRSERSTFDVYPIHQNDTLMPISFIEPEAINSAAVGLDIAHESNRRRAAQSALATGRAQITGPIVLVQDETATAGFLFYAPFGRNSGLSGDAAQAPSPGLVYAPFVVAKLMSGLLDQNLRQINISISDQSESIYNEHIADNELTDPSPMFRTQTDLNIYGRQWSLDIRSNLAFRNDNANTQPTIILVGGLIIEGLIVSLLIMMARASKRTKRYAEKVTIELKHQKQQLERSNRELEQFSYAASHDLKTPIRGVAGLTEILREDLFHYMQSPASNPDIANTLDLIMDRVDRMNDLTSGIIEFAQVNQPVSGASPADLEEILRSLRMDLKLRAEQLTFTSDVKTVTADTLNVRRVLENLVVNAVKYHSGSGGIRISVTCQEKDDRLRFTVSDNGPGIEEKYHEQIFEMFKTLRTSDSPESTGIGLAIVKKAVESNGGQITVSSILGQGCQFEFDWPASDHSAAA